MSMVNHRSSSMIPLKYTRQTHTHTVIFYCNDIDTNLVYDYVSILTSVILTPEAESALPPKAFSTSLLPYMIAKVID